MSDTPRSDALFKADRVILGVLAGKPDKIRVTYQDWKDARVLLDGQYRSAPWDRRASRCAS
jgi:hypothetical protein